MPGSVMPLAMFIIKSGSANLFHKTRIFKVIGNQFFSTSALYSI